MLLNKELLLLAKNNIRPLIKLILIHALFISCSLITSVYLSDILYTVIFQETSSIYLSFIFLILLLVIGLIIQYYITEYSPKCSAQIILAIRKVLTEKIEYLGLMNITESRSGNIHSLILDRTESLSPYYTVYIPNFFVVIVSGIIGSVYLININLLSMIFFIAGITGVLITPFFTHRFLWKTGTDVWDEYDTFISDFLDNIQGMETLRMLKGKNIKRENIKKTAKNIHKKTMANLKITSLENLLMELSANMGAGVSILYSLKLFSDGKIGAKEFLIVIFLVISAYKPLFSLINSWHLGYHGVTASRPIADFLSGESLKWKTVKDNGTNFNGLETISLKFNYGTKEVLKEMNLVFPEGRKIGIIGKSGSGKTTLAYLLAGLMPYNEGLIGFLDNVLHNKNIYEWREKVVSIWQEPYIFKGTVKENLLMVKPDATDEEISDSLKKAHLYDFIDQLPEKLNTELSSSGSLLSGGEKQRLSLARCFLKSGNIIIFDEGTSSLDEMNQKIILNGIESLKNDKSILIMIAHRINTVEDSDVVYVIENGTVIKEDTLPDILGNPDIYVSSNNNGGEKNRKQ